MASLLNKFLTNNINKKILKLDSRAFLNSSNIDSACPLKVSSRNFIITSHVRSNQKPNINIGTIGHIDHGFIFYLNFFLIQTSSSYYLIIF
jgi:hypothetical protein